MKAKSNARGAVQTKAPEASAKKLRLGLPKGSLQDATIEKMAKAGFSRMAEPAGRGTGS